VDAPWESVNFTEVNATGVEATLALNLQEMMPAQHILKRLQVAYSYIDQDKVETDGIQSQYTLEYLRHKLVAQLQANLWKRLNANLSYRMQDRTGSYTNADGEITDYKPYGIVDARLSWNADSFTLYVEANNLLDKTYVDFGHIAQPGRWWMAGFSIQL
jgi:iron complex outermembrane receptor protein